MLDISNEITIDDIPVCPLCDNVMRLHDEVHVVCAQGRKCLVHTVCTEYEDD